MGLLHHSGLSRRVESLTVELLRFARILAGDSQLGLSLTEEARRAFVPGPQPHTLRVDMYRELHAVWRRFCSENKTFGPRLAQEVFLLHRFKEFRFDEIAEIIAVPVDDVVRLDQEASNALKDYQMRRVLLIEDEILLAMEMSELVNALGHEVIGVARTCANAIEMARADKPDLVIADVRLADGSCGVNAVDTISELTPDLPSIFVTAYPERLLTGAASEPAFLLNKPFKRGQMMSALAMALTMTRSGRSRQPTRGPAQRA